MKFKRVSFTIEYIVPADPDVEEYAQECIYEELRSQPHGWNSIKVEDAPDAGEDDVPEFITEYLEEKR